jgi:DNA-binding NarL/FixJ family response regulator
MDGATGDRHTGLEMTTLGTTLLDVARVLIVDDHKMVAMALAGLVADTEDLQVVGIGHTATEAVVMAHDLRPDVAVIDWQLPDGDGVEVGRAIRDALPECKLVLVTASPEHAAVAGALGAGFSSMVLKTASGEELVAAILASARDEATFSPELLTALVRSNAAAHNRASVDLTAREVEILQMVADSRSNAEISTVLHISQHTVRNHVRNILAKLGAHTRLQAVVAAVRAGAVRIDGS